MIGRTFFAFCLLALSAGAAASDQAPPKGKADPNKIVCRTISESGSRLKKTRACHTVAEWAEIRRQTKDAIDHIQNSRAASGN